MNKVIILILSLFMICSCDENRHKEGPEQREIVEKYYLYSIRNFSSISGNISGTYYAAIGSLSGSVGSDTYLCAYVKQKDGRVLRKYNYKDVELEIIDESKTPFLEKYYTYRNDTIKNLFGGKSILLKKYKSPHSRWGEYWSDYNDHLIYRYRFYVPENSIISEFNLNLSNLK